MKKQQTKRVTWAGSCHSCGVEMTLTSKAATTEHAVSFFIECPNCGAGESKGCAPRQTNGLMRRRGRTWSIG